MTRNRASMIVRSLFTAALLVSLAAPASNGTSVAGLVDFDLHFSRIQREQVYDMVERHRRGSSDDWKRELTNAIFTESLHAEIDPLLVASIVAKESSFKSRVVSRAGAVGLMQLRPFVAKDVAQRAEIPWDGIKTLHRPEVNVRLGILYYQELLERFDGDRRKALTAYNYGPTRVSRQERKGVYKGSRYADGIVELYEAMQREIL